MLKPSNDLYNRCLAIVEHGEVSITVLNQQMCLFCVQKHVLNYLNGQDLLEKRAAIYVIGKVAFPLYKSL